MIEAGSPRKLGGKFPRLVFGEEPKPEGAWAGRRLALLGGKPAFELSFWCGTCPFLFKRLDGATETLSIEQLSDQLRVGLDDLDESVVGTFDALLAEGQFMPLLLEVEPRLVSPVSSGDYFAHEQVASWGVESFSGLPVYPGTAYYRTFETKVAADAHLYEFVVPMVPPTWNEATKVAEYAALLAQSSKPTAVAVSTLDVCAPESAPPDSDRYQHWGLTHFLLDGHHKFEAAAASGRPLRLLSLLSLDASLAQPEQLERIPRLRSQPLAPRKITT